MIDWLVFAMVGQVLIFIWQNFQLPFKSKWFEKLQDCSLCSGVWIYGILAIAFNVNIFEEMVNGVIANIIGNLVTAAITSYMVHVFIIGWKAKHEVVII